MWWPRRGKEQVLEATQIGLPSGGDYWERLALFTSAFARGRAEELLGALVDGRRDRALEQVRALAAASSSERQARLAMVFGQTPEDPSLLRERLTAAGPALVAAILCRLPAPVRATLSDLTPADAPAGTPAPAPLLDALAARWIREARR